MEMQNLATPNHADVAGTPWPAAQQIVFFVAGDTSAIEKSNHLVAFYEFRYINSCKEERFGVAFNENGAHILDQILDACGD